jgi:hypothetical protein
MITWPWVSERAHWKTAYEATTNSFVVKVVDSRVGVIVYDVWPAPSDPEQFERRLQDSIDFLAEKAREHYQYNTYPDHVVRWVGTFFSSGA